VASDTLFGGTPLLPIHFESDVAKAVFNDLGLSKTRNQMRVSMESRIFTLLEQATPKLLMRWSRQIDVVLVPFLSPSAFREFCSFFCVHLPQAIENMPNTRESVIALARAVHVSKFFNPAALDRIYEALKREGLSKD
jgi:hypothetical protein